MTIGVPPVNGKCFRCSTWSGSLVYVVQTDDVIFKCPKCERLFTYKGESFEDIYEEVYELIAKNVKHVKKPEDLW